MDRTPRPGWTALVAEIAVRSYRAWRRDRVLRLGAGLAYYALFALVPFLVIALGVASRVVTTSDLRSDVVMAVANTLALDPAVVNTALRTAIDEATALSGVGFGLIGAASLVLSASLVFVALQDALDVIWHVPVQTGLEQSVRRRAVAFGVVLAGGGVLIAVSAVQSVVGVLVALLPSQRPVLDALSRTLLGTLMWALVAGVVAVLFRVLPGRSVRWRAALVGGALTTLVLVVGTRAFGLYLRTVAVGSTGGAASGVIVALLYSYFVSQVVLGGAVVTRQIDRSGQTEPIP
jgi:membrane protein